MFPRVVRNCAFVFVALLVAAATTLTHANPVSTPNVKAWLISELEAVPAGETFWVALRQEIREEWHTYWKNPGDSGEPTTIDWVLPEGFEAGDILWPAPTLIPLADLVNFGYSGDVYFLVPITAPADLQPGTSVTFTANARWLVCKDICIPEEATLNLTLDVAGGEAAPNLIWAKAFAKTRMDLPVVSPWRATFGQSDDQVALQLDTGKIDLPSIKNVEIYSNQEGVLKNAIGAEFQKTEGGLSIRLKPGSRSGEIGDVFKGLVVIEEDLKDGVVRRAFEIEADRVPFAQVATGPSFTAVDVALWQALVFAFIGGLILNLMPCVLPVLSMKALHIVRQAREAPWIARQHGLFYAAGVLVSFLIVGGALISLRAAGEQIGWGFQLQSPVIVTLLAYLMFAVGLNLANVYSLGNSLMGIGSGLASGNGLTGSFFTGVLATVVATPCTAPFMGTALGFALVQPTVVALGIFAALGLGLAAPYLAVSFSPALLRLIPKPGAWMERFKQFLAFPMFATAIWLLWVLSSQVDSTVVILVLAGAMLIAFAAWMFESTKMATGLSFFAGRTLAIVAVGGALALIDWSTPQAAATAPSVKLPDYAQAYSDTRLQELRAQDRAVFVNLTADWCITCKANESVAFTDSFYSMMADRDIAYLVGDWTLYDETIAKKLSDYGRAGVPLYVVYPKPSSSLEPFLLPQLLTEGIVLDALDDL